MERIQLHVGNRQNIQVIGVVEPGKKADAVRHIRKRLGEALPQKLLPGHPIAQQQLALRVAAKNAAQNFIEFGMKLERRLKADIDVVPLCQAEMPAWSEAGSWGRYK